MSQANNRPDTDAHTGSQRQGDGRVDGNEAVELFWSDEETLVGLSDGDDYYGGGTEYESTEVEQLSDKSEDEDEEDDDSEDEDSEDDDSEDDDSEDEDGEDEEQPWVEGDFIVNWVSTIEMGRQDHWNHEVYGVVYIDRDSQMLYILDENGHKVWLIDRNDEYIRGRI